MTPSPHLVRHEHTGQRLGRRWQARTTGVSPIRRRNHTCPSCGVLMVTDVKETQWSAFHGLKCGTVQLHFFMVYLLWHHSVWLRPDLKSSRHRKTRSRISFFT